MIKQIFKALVIPGDLWLWFVTGLPGRSGMALRRRYWAKRLKSLGKNVRIDPGVYFQNPRFISIGDNTWIDHGVILLAGPDPSERPRTFIPNEKFTLRRGELYIGNNVHVAPQCIISAIGGVYISDYCTLSAGVKMYSFTHHYKSNIEPGNREIYFSSFADHKNQFMIEGAIYLDKNVGVALNSVILPGVHLEKDSFVMINSLVHSSFGENSLIAGTPAKKIKDRFDDS